MASDWRVGDNFVGDVEDGLPAVLAGLVLKGISAMGGAQDGAAARQDDPEVFERELARLLRPDPAVEAVGDANDSPLVLDNGRFDDGADAALRPGASPPPVPMPTQRMSDTLTRALSVGSALERSTPQGAVQHGGVADPVAPSNFKTARKKDG